jgi:hypothetical protein
MTLSAAVTNKLMLREVRGWGGNARGGTIAPDGEEGVSTFRRSKSLDFAGECPVRECRLEREGRQKVGTSPMLAVALGAV